MVSRMAYNGNNDPDCFRLEVTDAGATSASVRLQVRRGTSVPFDEFLTLAKHEDVRFRGEFLRLVTDGPDDSVSDQTIRVQLGDTARATYSRSGMYGELCKELTVGRPSTENDNGADQLRHDIRTLKLHVVVFRNQAGSDPAVTRAVVEADIATINERLAQSTIRVDVLSIDMGGAGDPGVALPAALGNGYTPTAESPITAFTADELAVIALKDADDDSVDMFYVDEITIADVRAVSYGVARNNTGNPAGDNFIVISGTERQVLTAAHECMHILLNEPDRPNAPGTSLFKSGTTVDKRVDGTKRIGPYPDAATSGVGNGDTDTIRDHAEVLW